MGADLHEIADGHDDLLRLHGKLAGWVHDEDLPRHKSPPTENVIQRTAEGVHLNLAHCGINELQRCDRKHGRLSCP